MNKNIVIVGASSGLGKALVFKLAKNNNLVLLSRNIKKLKIKGRNIKKITCDIREAESIVEAFNKIDSLFPKIDVFINCAGIGLEKKLEDSGTREIEDVVQTNLLGAILSSKQAYKRMLKNKSGHIINISSTSGKKAREKETVYCASKWGLSGFSESLRLEAKENNIKVTTVYPGGMKTDFYKNNQSKDISSFMNPLVVAKLIVDLIKSDPSICPSELVIERR